VLRVEITAATRAEIVLDGDSATALRDVLADADLAEHPGLEELMKPLIGPGVDAGTIVDIDDLQR
jgi:hypothetical protein